MARETLEACGGWENPGRVSESYATLTGMSALRRVSRYPGSAASSGFERSRLSAGGAGIWLAPVLSEPVGFAVDLERVLAGVPRRALPVEPCRPGPHVRRARGRWPRTPFHLPSAARIWVRDKGRQR
jgi:hypothetical protein